jgi:hypothetical protein
MNPSPANLINAMAATETPTSGKKKPAAKCE